MNVLKQTNRKFDFWLVKMLSFWMFIFRDAFTNIFEILMMENFPSTAHAKNPFWFVLKSYKIM